MAKQNRKRQRTGKAFLTSLLSLLLSVAMLVGTTYAWFTDSVTSGKNNIRAGNLDLEVTHVNAKVTTAESIQDATNLWNKDVNGKDILWEPGVVSYETFTVKNAGTLALTYKLLLNQLAAASNYNTVVSTDDSDGMSLLDVLYVHAATGTASATRPATKMAEEDKTIADLLSDEASVFTGNLEAGAQSANWTVYIYWPTDDGNNCNIQNGKSTSDSKALWMDLSVTASATQFTYESDSFDNQYDKTAEADTGSGDNPEQDDPDALWFNTTVSGAMPSDVTSIAFTKNTPVATEYDSTWSSPANSTAYYNSTSKTLTYVPKGDSFKMTDENLLKISTHVPVKGMVNVTDAIIIDTLNEWEETNYSTIQDILDYFESDGETLTYDDLKEMVEEELSEDCCFDHVTSVTGLNLWDVSSVTDFSSLFKGAKVTSIDISDWDTSNATKLSDMFCNCIKLTELKLGTKWNTASVTDMSGMFDDCCQMKSLPTTGFDTAQVTDMHSMFGECGSLESLDLSSFNTSNVTDMGSMFEECRSLESLDLSSFDTSNVTNMVNMFHGCGSLKSLDLSSFNTSNVTNMSSMFWNSCVLEHIYVGSGWNTGAVTASTSMFASCSNLPNYNSSSTDKTNAHTGEGGYLETKS